MRAFRLEDHRGYHKWHRNLDNELIIAVGKAESVLEFETMLNEIYEKDIIVKNLAKSK
ncbi:MAG: hypothetical protein MR485_06400 [Mollicutes bacterium]|nr:hypothetical protein [Mollicutes bacterium]